MNAAPGARSEQRDRPVVAVARSHRGDADDLIGAIGPTSYQVVDVVVQKSMIDELTDLSPDLVIIDNALGDFDGRRLCRDVRRSIGSPIILIPAEERNADDAWIVEAVESGADEVVPRSISDSLLRSRLFSLMRSAPDRHRTANELVVGDVVVDVDGYSVFVGGDLVRFPSLQFSLLVALARRPNKVVSCDELLSEVWGVEPQSVNSRRVRVAASMLRRLLGSGALRPRLETVSRVGYRLILPPP